MRTITGGVFLSLDGVMQAPGGPLEDPTGGFDLGGWTTSYWDEKMGAQMGRMFSAPFELLLGRKTYEIFAAHWPFAPEGDPIAARFNRVAKHVLTRGGDALEWNNSHKLGGVDDVRRLKATSGADLLIQGSSTLYPALFSAGLIDRLFVMTFPVALARGKRLFGPGAPPRAFRLIEHDVSTTGVRMDTYEPAGEVALGSFQLAEPSAAERKRRERMKREG